MATAEVLLSSEDHNHLHNVLSESELSVLPDQVADKINKYISSKLSVIDSGCNSECDSIKLQLKSANNTIAELENQLKTANVELEASRGKIISLEKEISLSKSIQDSALNERKDLTQIIQRRDAELERLRTNETYMTAKLSAAIDAKCNAITFKTANLNNEEASQYQKQRFEQEKSLLNSQLLNLSDTVNRLGNELETVRLENTSKICVLEIKLKEKNEELISAHQTIQELNELTTNLNSRAETLAQKLFEQREVENKMAENYKKEVDAKARVVDLYKSIDEDANSKVMELNVAIKELQKLLQENTEKYGELETKYKQLEIDHDEVTEKKNEMISSLMKQLEHSNELLKSSTTQNFDNILEQLTPSGLAASRLNKTGMSLTEVYSHLVTVSNDIVKEREENKELKHTILLIVQELEEKAPLLQKQKAEYEEAMDSNIALSQQLEYLASECKRLREDYAESSKIANHYNRENTILKGELTDLGKQVCFLLKEIEQSRHCSLPNGDHDSSHMASNTTTSSETSLPLGVSKTLVTFTDIQELQSNNQKLLGMVRELTEKHKELEHHPEQLETVKLVNENETLKKKLVHMKEDNKKLSKMSNGLLTEKDMYKRLYHDYLKGKQHELSGAIHKADKESVKMEDEDLSCEKTETNKQLTDIEIKLKETEKLLEVLKVEYNSYKSDKVKNDKLLFDQIHNMRQEITNRIAANNKYAAITEYNNERLKILQTNVASYKIQIVSLKKDIKKYEVSNATYDSSIQNIQKIAIGAQNKLVSAEATIKKCNAKINQLTNIVFKLENENKLLLLERPSQGLLLKDLEAIKVNLERVQTENYVKLEKRLEESSHECAALRRRLQEEQDRFRELISQLESQNDSIKVSMQEEKMAADAMRIELAQLQNVLNDKNKSNEQLLKKLKMTLTPDSNELCDKFDSIKIIIGLENELKTKDKEHALLKEQLDILHENNEQYNTILECTETELKNIKEEFINFRHDTSINIKEYTIKIKKLEDHCSELEAKKSLSENTLSTNLLNEEIDKEQLKQALDDLDKCRNELMLAHSDLNNLSENLHIAEEKYSHEILLHSADIQALSQAKEELTILQNQVKEVTILKDSAINNMESEKLSIIEKKSELKTENQILLTQLDNLNRQNSLLHDQIQILSTQLSVTQTSRSFNDNINESTDSNINTSITEAEGKSPEQLLQIIKFLRKEKDIAITKCDILQAEIMRLKTQLESTEKKLDNCKLLSDAEREKSEINVVAITKQANILREVETVNALTDSNRILRDERDSLLTQVQELIECNNALEVKMTPLYEQISELTSKVDILQTENMSMKAHTEKWRTRVTDLIERGNKACPEDMMQLKSEQESLVRKLSLEKENVTKLVAELDAIKAEKIKLKEQHSLLSRKYSDLLDNNKKLNDHVKSTKDTLISQAEELKNLKSELATSSESTSKLMADLKAKDNSLIDIRNKEIQIRKIAKKYKTQYEELILKAEEEKKKLENDIASINIATVEGTKKSKEHIAKLQNQLDIEKINNDKLKTEIESLKKGNVDKDEKAKLVLKQAKTKLVQLTESKNKLNQELNEALEKGKVIEQSNREENDVRLSLIKSQYEGKILRLEKEKNEAQEKINMLQRQLASHSVSSKQQALPEKACEPPTANIKPLAGVAQQAMTGSRRSGETPLASIRPVAQVGPTAPHDAHSTEYMPASSSRPRAAVTASTAPPESTQDMDISEAGGASSAASDSTAQILPHSQTPQQGVALVMPRIEQGSNVASSDSNTMASASSTCSVIGNLTAVVTATVASVSPNVSTPLSGTTSTLEGSATSSSGGVSTSLTPSDQRPVKRPRPPPDNTSPMMKKTKLETHEVEYQVPTSSRCDQDDEGVIVVDSEEDDERCTGTTYQEVEEEEDVDDDEELEEEEEVGEEDDDSDEGEEEDLPHDGSESPEQSVDAGSEGTLGEQPGTASAEADSDQPAAMRPQIQAISSGTETSGAMSLGGSGYDGDESIVPSTPTLYVPRRNDGFGDAVVSPQNGAGSSAAGSAHFTFAVAGAASHHDTHADLTGALTPSTRADRRDIAPTPGEAGGAWEDGVDDTLAVSSQGNQPRSQQQVPEEGREAEASSTYGD